MGLQETPSANRLHIAFFGCRNVGKSSLVNAVTDQDLALVSDKKGTTTDPVKKAMELLPLGPVVIIDTPGYDDEGELGKKRVSRTKRVLNQADIAVLVVDQGLGLTEFDRELLGIFREKEIPYLIAWNKMDMEGSAPIPSEEQERVVRVSAKTKENIWELKERIGHIGKAQGQERVLVRDLVCPGDFVVLVTPIDESAPKGRMILPQQQMIRDVLDGGAINVVVKETELKEALEGLKKPPRMVITDSQAFELVSKVVPPSVPLTSFSILLARYKGFLDTAVRGAAALKGLKDGDHVLVSEGCTHHRQCNDIGTVKLPRWLQEYTGAKLTFHTCSGVEFPEDLSPYQLVLHCGGCMLGGREMAFRMKCAVDQGIPFTNYGISIAAFNGILKRSLEVFGDQYQWL
ncbi:MAG: [FeFe] hydrogenase H-cluster maturation GTPase HydF [Eubacteriales bacterium]|nr:[FeFe] hydrogenase H-cluster maturation GTPase HydF [Eubacteriales bacterium]